ncbi:MAG TPA: membrane protein insertase YidC [Verrucomicrobiae bacterium]|nr:membrane protein insertase YidC [Verrucomicrobiae bacterium]
MAEYHKPQDDPNSQNRVLIAIVLFAVGFLVMQYFTPKPQPPAPAPQKQETQQQQQPQQPQQAPSPSAASAAATGKTTAAPVQSFPTRQAEAETETTIETKLYRVVFTNRGGQVKSWVLKKGSYLPDADVELVNPAAAPGLGYPLSFFTYDKDLEKKLNEALWVSSATGPQKPPFVLKFDYSTGSVQATKKFTFDESFVISVDTEVINNGQKVQAYPQWPSGFGDLTNAGAYANEKVLWQQDKDIERKAAQSGFFLTGKKWIANGETVRGPLQWAATADQYFAAAFMPASPENTALVTLHNQIDVAKDPDKPNEEKVKADVLGVAAGDVRGTTHERLFVGPKAVELLESIRTQPLGPDLRGMLDLGWFGFISRPLYAWLVWTHDHWTPNWGWSIGVLTVIINLVLLPLRVTSIKSALKMQKIQPQMKTIQEKYKRYGITDPRRAEMQKEMQALYKQEGVNPLGGCFPMLLQMPFLIAFYSMISNSFEMRHASWVWIHDLSAADPWHILPVIVIVTMFFTQQSTPSGGMDPAQQKMMKYMTPLMIGGMTWYLPSGLGIYWAIGNIIAFIQQTVINRSSFGRQVRKTVERRAKRKR